MALFGPKHVRCPAGVWTVLVDDVFVQLPRLFELRFEVADGLPVEGELEEKKSAWIFPGAPAVRPLVPVVQLERGYFNTFYRVRVRPVRDVVAVVS